MRQTIIIIKTCHVGKICAKSKVKMPSLPHYGCAVVEWWRSRPLDCEVRGSKPGQGRNLKREFCFVRTRWWRRVTRAGWGHKTPLYKTWTWIICYPLGMHMLPLIQSVFPMLLQPDSLPAFLNSFIHSNHFYSASSSPLLLGYCAGVSRRSATGNCELKTCPRSLRGG